MAHLMETMAWAGQTPWHGLGERVSDDLTTEQMQIASGTNWKVRKNKLGFFANGVFVEVPDTKMALVRQSDNKVLSMVSEHWNEVQNDEAFDFFRHYVEAGKMKMHTAGSLKEGRVVWVLAKLEDGFTIKHGKKRDEVESYLLFTNPHEYGRALDIRFTPIRVVCNNTLTLALHNQNEEGVVRLNHRQKFDPDHARQVLGLAEMKMEQYSELAEFLASKQYTKAKVRNYIKSIFPNMSKNEDNKNELSRPATRVLELVETSPGADIAPGTWWNAFNAVTFAIDHELGHTADTRLQSSWYGVNKGRKVLALNRAKSYATA